MALRDGGIPGTGDGACTGGAAGVRAAAGCTAPVAAGGAGTAARAPAGTAADRAPAAAGSASAARDVPSLPLPAQRRLREPPVGLRPREQPFRLDGSGTDVVLSGSGNFLLAVFLGSSTSGSSTAPPAPLVRGV